MERRIASNAKELAREGEERKPFYLTGRVGDANISLHAEGDRVVLMHGDGAREEVDLGATGKRAERESGGQGEANSPSEPTAGSVGSSASEVPSDSTNDSKTAAQPVSQDASPPDSPATEDDSLESSGSPVRLVGDPRP